MQDFNRACELAPATLVTTTNVRWSNSHSGSPSPLQTTWTGHCSQSRLRGRAGDARPISALKAGYGRRLADLDAADRVAPKESDVRLTLAMLYGSLDHPAQVIAQTNLWIPVHDQDPRVIRAYNDRCWARALLGQELDEALHDCNAGLRLEPQSPDVLDSRGLVELRRNQFDKAIADYNEALKINPKIAWSLYGRGIAELRKGMTAKGEADVDAAKALAPHLAEFAHRIGVSP